MIIKQEHTGFIKVEDYGFAEWLAQVEQVIKQGYEFDFVNNENYPVGYGSMYTAVLVPVKVNEAQETQEEPESAPLSPTVEPLVETPVAEVTVEPVQAKRKYNKG